MFQDVVTATCALDLAGDPALALASAAILLAFSHDERVQAALLQGGATPLMAKLLQVFGGSNRACVVVLEMCNS